MISCIHTSTQIYYHNDQLKQKLDRYSLLRFTVDILQFFNSYYLQNFRNNTNPSIQKEKLDKDRKSVWNPQTYEVEDIKQEKDQEFYYLGGFARPVLRHELPKVRS